MIMCCVTPVMANANIKVKLGGELIKFDVKPQLINDRTMVPLRAIFEALGAKVEWNGETQTVTATKKDTTISLTINDATMLVNGEAVTLDSPACLVDGRTLVPVRAVSEAFNLKVDWSGNTNTVMIRKPVSVISEDNEGRKYTYDENGNLISEITISGGEIKHGYDEVGNLLWEEPAPGKRATYTYDENHNLIRMEDFTKFWINYSYDENGNMVYEENSFGGYTKNTYNDEGNLIRTEYRNSWKEYTYDANGKLTCWNDSYGTHCEYTYDANGNLETTYKEAPAEGYWERNTYAENGNLMFTEASNNQISYEYDANGNLLYEEDFFKKWKRYTYDENGNLIYKEDSDGKWEKYIVIEK